MEFLRCIKKTVEDKILVTRGRRTIFVCVAVFFALNLYVSWYFDNIHDVGATWISTLGNWALLPFAYVYYGLDGLILSKFDRSKPRFWLFVIGMIAIAPLMLGVLMFVVLMGMKLIYGF